MPRINTRQEFVQYCLRRLGYPVINIEVDLEEQVEDRIDDALAYYSEYHYDAVENSYYGHVLTEADFTNKYMVIPEEIIRVDKIVSINNFRNLLGFDKYLLDNRPVNHLNTGTYTTTSTDQTGSAPSPRNNIDFFMLQDQQALINSILERQIPIRFNRHTNKVYLDTNWNRLSVDMVILLECKKIIDPEEYPDVWNDWWLKRYATALIKRQWGENLIKFQNVQLPGGTSFDAERIYQTATDEITLLEQEIQEKFELPFAFAVG
jgi:hypothetical protein